MIERPLISVIIPSYNYGNYLTKAVESVLNQTYDNIEIIVVDDCSTDNTQSIMNKFKRKKVRYYRQLTNVGQSENRNTGLKLTKGRFIAFLDADDWYHPKFLETTIPAFTDPEVGCAYTLMQGWKDGKKFDIGYQKAIQGKIVNDLFITNFIGTRAVFRKNAILNGYETNLCPEYNNMGVDWWILLKLSISWKIIGFKQQYYNCNFHTNSISDNPKKRICADRMIQQRFLKEHSNLIPKKIIKEARFWSNLREGIYYRQINKNFIACMSFLRAILNHPFNTMPYKSLIYTIVKGK